MKSIINIEFYAGQDFKESVVEARRLRGLLTADIQYRFNGVSVVVMGNDVSKKECEELFFKELKKEHGHLIVT